MSHGQLNDPSETMRLFVALDVRAAPPLRRLLDRLSQMGRSVRPVSADQLHLTLRFLGDVAAGRVDEVRAALDASAAKHRRFDWTIAGLGAFPHIARPRVVWAGCHPAEPLVTLADSVEQRLAERGFERSSQPFAPHVTLARVRDRAAELTPFLENAEEQTLVAESARELVLYHSVLRSHGAVHRPIHRAPLET